MHLTREIRAALGAAVVLAGMPVLSLAGSSISASAASPDKTGGCTIRGTSGDDVLVGTRRDDVICGLGGDDKLLGRGGDDVLRGDAGDDVLRGGAGDDWISSGPGDDRALGQDGDDLVRGDRGDDEVVGGPGDDRLSGFRGADVVRGDGDPVGFVDRLRCGPGPGLDEVSADPADVVDGDCERVLQNDPPTELSLSPSSVRENAPVGTVIGALSVTDPDAGDGHTFSLVAGAGSVDNGLARVVGGSLVSKAVLDHEAEASLSVRVRATDKAGELTERAFTVTVTDANDAPVAVDDDAAGTEDTTVDLPVSGAGSPVVNDTDQDGDSLTVSAVSTPTGGTVSISGGQVHFDPAQDVCGPGAGSFVYSVSDGSASTPGTDTGTVTVDLSCVEDTPTAVDDSRTVAEDSGATSFTTLRDNDTDPESDPISITGASDPAHGSTSFTAADVIYTPDAGYCGADSFTYTVNGGDTATVSVTVTCVNDAPTAVDDERTTPEDAPLQDPVTGAGSPAANDTDADAGDALTVTAVSNPTGGTVAIASGQVTFNPSANLCGPDSGSYDYTVSDGATPTPGTDTGTVTIDISCDDDAPVANDDSRTVAEDSGATTFATLRGNDTDAESDPITITGVSDPANGSTSFSATAVDYTPDADHCGSDSFTYTVNGGDTATVTVTVSCVDDAPVAIDDTRTVTEDSGATTFTGLLGNDTDVESDPITITGSSDPANGDTSFTAADVTYTPDADYCGADSFTYTVDGGDTATVSVTVTCVDDDPTAADDSATVTLNDAAAPVDVLGNDDNADGGPMAIASASDPAHGTVALTGGSPGEHTGLTYEPDPGYCNTDPVGAADTFTYTLTPGGDTATVSVTVTCDVPPVAVDDTATVAEDAPAGAVDVLANDTDADGGPKAVTAVSDPADGTATFTAAGVSYAPDADFCGADAFTYTVNGGDTATVAVTVTCVNDAPVASDDSDTVAEDSGATAFGTLLGNDTDAENDPITITGASDPTHGATIFTANDVTYTPDADYCGADSFTYTVNGGDTATVSVTVTCVADAPTLDTSAGTTTFTEDTAPVVVDAALTITNPDGLAITAGSVVLTDDLAGDVLDWTDNDTGDSIVEGTSTSLQVVLTGTGTAAEWQAALRAVTFATPSQNPSGADRTATFEVSTSAGSPSDTKLVDAANADDLPTADADSATVLEDAGVTAVTVLANDDDVDAGPMTISSVSDPANGTTAITGGGTGLTYSPDANYCNDPGAAPEDTFSYTLNGGGAPQTATVSMTVTCVNDAPVADDETFGGANGAIGNTSLVVDDPTDGAPTVTGARRAVTGDILDGDTDIDSPGPLTVTAGTFATNDGGSVTLQADGDFTYLPDDDLGCGDGSDFFDYTLNDGDSPNQTDTGRVTLSITDCVWYVQASAAPGGTGSSVAPLNTLTAVNGAGGAGDVDDVADYLFVYGGGTFTTGIVLEADQRLHGEPEGLTVDGTALVAAAGTNPTIRNTTAGGDGVRLADGADVQAVNVGVTGAGSTFGIRAISVTNATVGADVLVQGNGLGVGIQGAASGTITVGATINGSTGAAVSVQQRTGGSVTFSGDVTSTQINGTVEFVNNTGATLAVTGKLDISGSLATSLDVRGGGTFTAPNAANTITGVSGPGAIGVNLDAVTVGAAGIVVNTLSTAGGGAGNGLLVNGVTGTGPVTVNGGTLTTTVRGVDVNGGTGDVTVGAALEPTGGRSVEVTGHTGGTVDLNGVVSEDSTGVNLTGNTGATIRFDGGLVASTGANPAFTATGGGTVVVTGSANTLTTTTGAALTVISTSIGANGLTFRSISANGGSKAIVLGSTGAVGGLTVTGTGAAGTGGTIQNTSTRGAELVNTAGVSLSNMNFSNANNSVDGGGSGACDDLTIASCNSAIYLSGVSGITLDRVNLSGTMVENGITGVGVSGLTLSNSSVTGAGNEAHESGLEFQNLSGTSTISDTDVSFSETNSIDIVNTDVSGTLTLDNVTLRDTQSSGIGEGGVQFRSFSSAAGQPTTNLDVVNSDLLRLRTQAIQVIGEDDSIVNVDVTGNTIDSEADIGVGVDLNGNDTAQVRFNVLNNPTINSRGGSAVNVTAFVDAAIMGRINGNTIQANGSGAGGSGIRVLPQESSTGVVEARNNIITMGAGNNSTPIDAQARINDARLDLTLAGNSTDADADALADVNVTAGSSAAGETNAVCLDLKNHTAVPPGSSGGRSLRLRVSDLSNTIRMYLEGFTGTSESTWDDRANTPTAGTNVTQSLSGTAVAPAAPPGGTCAEPTNAVP